MWTEILGEDIYRMIDKEYCRLLVEKEEKLLRQGIQGELLQLFRSNQLYYRKPISKVNFESFFRFFISAVFPLDKIFFIDSIIFSSELI